jgi:hypothetical protein
MALRAKRMPGVLRVCPVMSMTPPISHRSADAAKAL